MRLRTVLSAAFCLFAIGAVARAQDQDLLPDKPSQNPPTPTITFQFEFTGANPSHYALSVDATGRAAYTSTGPQDENAGFAAPGQKPTGEPYTVKFSLSPGTTEHIFSTAARLNYFNGNFEYTKSRVANTGAKTLVYADPKRHFQTTFNWSQNQEAMDLARTFQGLSATLEFDRRLQDEMRHQKLALDEELKQLQDAAKHNDVAELQLLAPTLRKIADDSSVLHIARKRAQDLLASLSGVGQNGPSQGPK